MPEDQTLDTEDSAQDDQGQADQTPDEGQVDDQQQKPFTPEQEQYMGSWMGRIISKQFEEKVLPALQQNQTQFQDRQVNEGDALDKFNQKLHDMVLEGKVTEAFDLYSQVASRAKENLSRTSKIQTDKALTSYSEEPNYKDVYNDAKEIAYEMVNKGVAPEVAAETAYAKAELKYLKNKDSNRTPQQMLDKGKRVEPKKKAKLPDIFRKAYERDKKKGLFKDEQDYINNLSPEIRAKYGL